MVYFHTKNPNLGMYILEGLGMGIVGIFTAFWNKKCPFGYFLVILHFFLVFGILYAQRKIWQPRRGRFNDPKFLRFLPFFAKTYVNMIFLQKLAAV
jgi:hypothetical protein